MPGEISHRTVKDRAADASRRLVMEHGAPIPQAYRFFLAYLTGLKVDLDAEWRAVILKRKETA